MAADKRPPRRSGPGGGGGRPSGGGGRPGGGGGGGGRPGGGGGGAGGGFGNRWEARYPRPGERPDRPPRGDRPERGERRPAARFPAREDGDDYGRPRDEGRREGAPRPARAGRWEVLQAASLGDLAGLLNARGVQPDHVAHLIASMTEDEDAEVEETVWEALVWVG